jgi:nitrogen fixation protein FixH
LSPTSLVVRRPRGVQGRHVLAVSCVFFAIVFAVNGVLIYEAMSTHTGLVAHEPYRKGLAYNDRIGADERQALLGWSDRLEVMRDGLIVLTLTEADRPVGGLKIVGTLGRPATNRHDLKLVFAETAAGRYEAQANGISPGSWLVTLEMRKQIDAEPTYRSRKRLWITP